MYFRNSIKTQLRMYLMKIKGENKALDYLQIRDDNFVLIAYLRVDKLEDGLKKFGLDLYLQNIKQVIQILEFGKLKYVKNIN